MSSSRAVFFQSVLAFGLLLSFASCTDYQLGFLLRSTDPPGFARNFTESTAMLPTDLKNCEKLCARGMWALYTKPNFGEDKVDDTLVYPVQGSGGDDCTEGNVNGILKQIQSIKCLGSCVVEMTGFSYFHAAYFLQPVDDEDTIMGDGDFAPAALEADQIRSLAITIGRFSVPNTYTMCAKGANECYCYDQTLGLELMVPDVKLFPAEKPFGQLIDCIEAVPAVAPDYKCDSRFVQRAMVPGCQ